MRSVLGVAVGTAVFFAGFSSAWADAPEPKAVVLAYADIAQAIYEDSAEAARGLEAAVKGLTGDPSKKTLEAARAAWLAARVPYMQSEVFRFGNAIVDGWEGRVNAWPLDEGLIDYVDRASYGEASDENPWYTANIIANPEIKVGGKDIDARVIDAKLLRGLQEAGDIEANVATGYHAIEFLLWGQDLNGTGPGAGDRPWTDYARGAACTHGNCDRRAQYLTVATKLLVADLDWMAAQWAPGGAARETVLDNPESGIAAIVTGIGSLSYGELAGERIKLGLLLHDPEEEHDCFSDDTHDSHYYDVVGIENVYAGTYRRIDGSEVKGPGLGALVAARAPELDAKMRADLAATHDSVAALKKRAETVEHYDQMLAEGNTDGNAVVQAVVDKLTAQTKTLQKIVAALNLEHVSFEGSESLDSPEKVLSE